jgi:hypothetical protein
MRLAANLMRILRELSYIADVPGPTPERRTIMLHSEIWMYSRLFIGLFVLGVFVAMATFGIVWQRWQDRQTGIGTRPRASTIADCEPADRTNTAGTRPAVQPRAWIDQAPTQPRRAA